MKTSRTGKNSGMRTGALGTALWLSVLAAMSGCDDGNDNGDSAVGATQQDLPWVIASGEAQQAAPNTGYIAFNYESPVAITLPSTLAVGDVVAVVGAASGGWELRQNAGQYIVAEGEVGDVWIKRASYSGWMDVASCADGTRLVAADFPRSHLYFSDDSGLTWAARGPTNPWSSVACSTDGERLVAATIDNFIFTSTDGGATWTQHADSRRWSRVSSSPDGNTLAAVDMNGYLAVSNDAGDTWAQSGADKTWKDVKVTSDGTLVGIVDSDTAIFTSSDHGDTWTRHPIKASDGSGPPVSFWQSLAITPDGVNVYTYGDIADHRYVYASHDSGVVWERSEKVPSFSKMAVSSDGTRVVATELNGGIYISNDSGITWARRGLDGPWFGIDISPDGQAIIACQYGGYIYTSDDTPTTTVGTAGKLTGIRGDDVMLEYSGSGRFDVLNHAGTLSFE